MSWGEPKSLAPFRDSSPFFGLPVPDDVRVSAQVVAQPDPTLADRVIAALSDGTPLVTRKAVGQGQIVLFHVTATAEWSTLPLSGLFVEMLERLAVSSAASRPRQRIWTAPHGPRAGDGRLWRPARCGQPARCRRAATESTPRWPALPPGIYASDERRLARNVLTAGARLTPAAGPPMCRAGSCRCPGTTAGRGAAEPGDLAVARRCRGIAGLVGPAVRRPAAPVLVLALLGMAPHRRRAERTPSFRHRRHIRGRRWPMC